jgi:hypothetical protein
MILSIAQEQFDIYWLGIPYKVELSHYGFYAVMDMDGECQIADSETEGKILDKFFKWFNPRE